MNLKIKIQDNFDPITQDIMFLNPAFNNIRIDAFTEEDLHVGFIEIALLRSNNSELLLKNLKFDSVQKEDIFKIQYIDKPMVRMIFINEDFRGNKLSIDLYQAANKFIKETFNLCLYSDTKNWIKASAYKNYNLMIELGIAEDIGDRFRFI